MVRTFSEVIELWPSSEDVAADLGASGERVRKWKARNSIPGEYWQALTAAALKRNIEGVSLEVLAHLAAEANNAAA